MAMALRGRTTAVNIKLEMVMKIISTVVEFLQSQSNTYIVACWGLLYIEHKIQKRLWGVIQTKLRCVFFK